MNDLSHTGIISPLTFEAVSVSHRGQPLLHPLDLRLSGCRRTLVMGPNGAGKSLLLRLAHGLLPPSGGRIRWEGSTPRQAMVFQRPVLLRRSALANLTYALAVNGTPRRQRQALAMEALDHFGLASLARRPARVLSGGEQQRLALARAWLLRPQVLFLDEPTAGVDVELRREMWQIVRDLRDEGVTIILTTHYIEEAEEMADRIGVIRRGELVLVKEKQALMRQLGRKELTLQLKAPLAAVPEALAPYHLTLAEEGYALIYRYDSDANNGEGSGIAELLGALKEAGIRYSDLHTRQSSLEDIFVSLVQETEPSR